MRIAITGATGLVGRKFTEYFTHHGYSVLHIVRTKMKEVPVPTTYWDPNQRIMDQEALEGHDVIIHLAGENIAAQRWTQKQKERILLSRRKGTRLLCETLAQLTKPPQLLLSASAVGYYGNYPASITLDEQSAKGDDFLADVAVQWEAATQPAQQAKIRVVHMRFGVILSSAGGALSKMLPAFRLGLGGKIGNGQQMMSWIALEELPHIVDFIIRHPSISGAINVVSPSPVSNEEFTKTLATLLHRPALFSIPAPLLRILLGEMADALLIHGSKVLPRKLQDHGYSFFYPHLHQALSHILGKEKS